MTRAPQLPGEMSKVVNGHVETLLRIPGEAPADFVARVNAFLGVQAPGATTFLETISEVAKQKVSSQSEPTREGLSERAQALLKRHPFSDVSEGLMQTRLTTASSQQEPVMNPPRLAQFVLLLIPLSQREHLMGDLEEEFRMIVVPKYGPTLACWYYRWQVVVEVTKSITNGLNGVIFGWLFSKFTT